MSRLASLALFSFVFAVSSAFAQEFEVDASHSNVGFAVRHFVSRVSGEFRDFNGKFEFDAKKPETAKGSFTVAVSSVNTNNEKRDGHLKSEDFFHAEKHPAFTFVSKSFRKAGKNKFKMAGDLTLRGVTKPVTFDVEYFGSAKDFENNDRLGFAAKTKINRKDYGINWSKTLDNGGVVVGDEVEINLQIEAAAVKKQ